MLKIRTKTVYVVETAKGEKEIKLGTHATLHFLDGSHQSGEIEEITARVVTISRNDGDYTYGTHEISDISTGDIEMSEQPPEPMQKPNCPMIGSNGNIYSLMGLASQTLKRAGMGDSVQEMIDRVKACDNYTAALGVLMDYVTPVSAEPELEM